MDNGWIDAKHEASGRGQARAQAALPVGCESAYLLDLYGRYRRDPLSVPADWRLQFETMDGGQSDTLGADCDHLAREMIAGFRAQGHSEARLDPLGLAETAPVPVLDRLRRAAGHALDRDATYLFAGAERRSRIGDLLSALERAYCGTATLEAAHVADEEARDWIAAAFEAAVTRPADQSALESACEAVFLADEFESFVKLKLPTKKRFGSEGSQGSLVLLKQLLRNAAASDQHEVVIGGMHRGRLATLSTLLGKPLEVVLAELKGRDLTDGGADFTGDIPYHLGHAADVELDGVPIRVSIAPHPSHLMTVAPVALGLARGRRGDIGAKVLPLLLHTDAAFAGQGVAAEMLQLSGLNGYSVGGAIHVVVNNQIGFTTLPSDGRTARYCTDAGKMIGAPVFHVNGEDVVALMAVADVAHAWRQRYGSDVLIDMVCYRVNGHNELDEPRFTQPAQYAAIDARPSLRARLAQTLADHAPDAVFSVRAATDAFRTRLDAAYGIADTLQPNARPSFQAGWDRIAPADEAELLRPVVTGIAPETLARLAASITTIPDGIDAHPKVRRFHEERRSSLTEPRAPINFASAEALALASLLDEGVSVRMSGQDLVRGTFTQRHLRVHDLGGKGSAVPIANAEASGARFEAINSPLSEYAVLGFDYGHSLASPEKLALWEAQFGDFLNGAQIVLDQYISSAEAKWLLRSGLVMLLPHGLEGQGPDHSSARIERILQLCAGGNMLVANPTTPANYFHLIRRQIVAPWRKPLAVIAPKSLLRLKAAFSLAEDFLGETRFQPVIADRQPDPEVAERVVLCSGKVFYDLRAAIEAEGLRGRVSLVRIEQLYPLEIDALIAVVAGFEEAASLVWCQEEPRNQGPWPFVRDQLLSCAPDLAARITYSGRRALPVAAGGSVERHEAEQQALVADALGIG